MKQFLAALDCRSRAIWWHLCSHGHAKLSDLAHAAGLDSDMEVILCLRQVINPVATTLLGEPVVEFASCRVDQATGEKINFHWWLKPAFWSRPAKGQPLVDVFETGNELVIIVDLNDRADSCQPEVTCRNGIVMIRFDHSSDR
ncbi:hypothetical protein Psch_00732 [Pelotomaculum schinkii]|uniref:Uncharacterized protein n=1 Tax=Pelotomaculum schinkii TaxID=78350 RepID=A0A4Y7REI0_9FIRM|nr:hypothetical protein [Pelotomaculum schinkii]TEB07189.1 hypothetical protein Psch_00732 [Pelotomaculum schinkii]